MEDKIKQELIELCAYVIASSDLGYEVTLGGNGCNSSEASNMAYAVLDIIGTPDDFEELVQKETDEIEIYYR